MRYTIKNAGCIKYGPERGLFWQTVNEADTLEDAHKAFYAEGEAPYGTILIDNKDGEIIAEWHKAAANPYR